MNPFRKEKIVGLPDARDKNIYDRTPEQKEKLRNLAPEYGSDGMVIDLNRRIKERKKAGENIGEYKEDELSQKIIELERERKSIMSDDIVSDCYEKMKELILLYAEIPELQEETENVLSRSDNSDGGYNEKIKILNAKNQEAEHLAKEIDRLGEDVKNKVQLALHLDEEIGTYTEQHKKAFKNQNIKTVQGRYLN